MEQPASTTSTSVARVRDELPFLDEHRVLVAAPRAQVWLALEEYARSSLGVGEGNPVAGLLGTEPRTGFAVVEKEPEERLVVAGRHRFSRYRIEFLLHPAPERAGDGTVLAARSYAVFPGLLGFAYRTAVIGTRFHVLATRHVLNSIRQQSGAG